MATAPSYYQRPIEQFLRAMPKTHARSAYAEEVNPWTTKGDVEAALLFRGTIVSAFGYIDCKLVELCLRASRLDMYARLRSKFPYSQPERLKFLRKAFSFGPLKPYQPIATLMADKIEQDATVRHLVAHARMQVLPENFVSFHDYPRSDSVGVSYRRTPMSMLELERQAWKAALRSRTFQMLYCKLEEANVLPKLED